MITVVIGAFVLIGASVSIQWYALSEIKNSIGKFVLVVCNMAGASFWTIVLSFLYSSSSNRKIDEEGLGALFDGLVTTIFTLPAMIVILTISLLIQLLVLWRRKKKKIFNTKEDRAFIE